LHVQKKHAKVLANQTPPSFDLFLRHLHMWNKSRISKQTKETMSL